MKVKHKPVYKVGHESYSFDAKLRARIQSLRNLSAAERQQLYKDIMQICYEQVEDCCTSNTFAAYIALHDVFGFGQRRMLRVQKFAREVIEETVRTYGTSCKEALRRELERRNLRTEGGEAK